MKLANPLPGKHRIVLYYAGIGLAALGMLMMILAVGGAVARGGAAPRMVPLAVRAAGGVGLAALGLASMAVAGGGLPGSAIDMGAEFESNAREPRFLRDPLDTDDPLAPPPAGDRAGAPRDPSQAGPDERVCHW
ncbi:MAG TPA: hypothetical protein VML55_06535, partial [Planctomycetaceae bacterium]|nr:hypothetical protein [Planctomycetaceae bacterium]